MILFLIDAILIALFLIGLVAVYSVGFHKGVDVIARQELAEQFPDEYPLPAVAGRFVGERREVVMAQVEDNLYQIWRRAQGLPDNPTVRAMYNNEEYRSQLEAQKNVSQDN